MNSDTNGTESHKFNAAEEVFKFETGAIRSDSTGKGAYELISPVFLKRLALVMEKGAMSKYGPRNWEKGMTMGRTLQSTLRHLLQYLEGERGPDYEDHLGHAAFGIMNLIHTETMIQRDMLPTTLNDLPKYIKETK